jgi:chemotaxis protein methyltransferase CheR
MHLTDEEFGLISEMVFDLSGVVLDKSKAYLIEGRLAPVAKEAGCETFNELYFKVRHQGDRSLKEKVVDAITTHETLFFRDTSPFEALEHKVIPELLDKKAAKRDRRIRIWSAACSTGQEPFSVGMILHKLMGKSKDWNVSILGTDISSMAIAKASLGIYSDHEMDRGMKPEMRRAYFDRVKDGWRIKEHIRAMVSFRKLNLLEPISSLGKFDIVLCRNVAIYFSKKDRADLFRRIREALVEDGYLFTGSSEMLTDLGPEFRPQYHCRTMVYQPNLPVGSPRHSHH